MNKKILAAVVVILLNLGVLGSTSAETLTYKETRSGKESFRKAKIEKTGKSYVVTSTNSLNENKDTFETDQSLSLLKWRSERSEEGTDIIAVREGNRILISGKFKNEDYEKGFKNIKTGGKNLGYCKDKSCHKGLSAGENHCPCIAWR